MHLEIAQSTPTAAAMARVVQAHYPLGDVVAAEFLRRSFNQVYGLTLADGRRVVARLCAERPRGEPRLQFEADVLQHLRARGCPVAACLPTTTGDVAVRITLPEGEREVMLFEHLDGEATTDLPANIEAFGRGLAQLHAAGEGLQSSAPHYTLNLDHLLLRPLQHLLRAPTMTAELRPQFEALGLRLHDRIAALGELTQVLCHGDAHSDNNFITVSAGENGADQRQAVFFDFDDTGPGLLAYELCVYLWNNLPRKVDGVLDEAGLMRWRHYLAGYRSVRPLAQADVDAIAAFLAVRQFWIMGETAGRYATWGTQTMPTSQLRRVLKIMEYWASFKTPE